MKKINEQNENGFLKKGTFRNSIIMMLFILLTINGFGQADPFNNWICGEDLLPPPVILNHSPACLATSPAYVSRYGTNVGYVPDAANTPIKQIKIAFHFFQDATGGNNWQNNATTYNRITTIMQWLNGPMITSAACTDFMPNFTQQTESKVEYVLVPNGLYFYQDNVSNITTSSTVCEAAVMAIDPSRLDALPIYITNPPSSPGWLGMAVFPSETYLAQNSSVISLTGAANPSFDYGMAGHLRHELGHCIDQGHTYNPGETIYILDPEYLNDIFPPYDAVNEPLANWCNPSANYVCYMTGGDPYQNTVSYTDNDLMSGNSPNDYISPKRMGKMNRSLAIKSVRKYVQEMNSATTAWQVTQDETWDFDIHMYQDINVHPGATLTIKCKVGMSDNGNIIVERGGRLIIDGGEIYGIWKMWNGIQVLGNAAKKQTIGGSGLSTDQGIIKVINAGTIRDAYSAINTIKIDPNTGIWDWSYTGGIIQCDGANFVDNKRVVQYLTYHNHQTNVAGSPVINNIGYIIRSTFTTDGFLQDPSNQYPNYFITMLEVDGVRFLGNTYQNTIIQSLPLTTPVSIDQLGGGIFSINASFGVDRYQVCHPMCAGLPGQGCPSTCLTTDVESLFYNLQYGINSSGATLVSNIQINNNDFKNCNRGVFLSGINYSSITKNRFDLALGLTNPYQYLPYGIYMNSCSGYRIEENTITTSVSGNTNGTGIAFNGNVPASNIIYRNNIDLMGVGTTVYNDNRGTMPGDGLVFKCNNYGQGVNPYDNSTGSNVYDIVMQYDNTGSFNFGKIGMYQGTGTNGANNFFSHNCATTYHDNDYQDDPNWAMGNIVNYFFNPVAAQKTQPLCYTATPGLFNPFPNTLNFSSGTMCLPSSTIILHKTIPALAQVQINNAYQVGQLKSLIDGGVTQKMLDSISTGVSSDSIKNLLMSKSPYLSDIVLANYFERNQNTSNDIQEMALANSPVTGYIKTIIDSLTLPVAIRSTINQAQTGVSARSVLEQNMADLNYEKAFDLDNEIHYYLNDTVNPYVQDSIIAILKMDTSNYAKDNLLSAYIKLQQYTKADSMITAITADANGVMSNFCHIQQLIMTLDQTIDKFYTIQTDLSAQGAVEEIAIAIDQKGFNNAQALLKQVMNYHYDEYVSLPDAGSGSKRMVVNKQNNIIKEDLSLLKLFPNPTTSSTTASFLLPDKYSSATIVIYDARGKKLSEHILTNTTANSINIPTFDLSNGIYIVALMVDGAIIDKQKLVIQ